MHCRFLSDSLIFLLVELSIEMSCCEEVQVDCDGLYGRWVVRGTIVFSCTLTKLDTAPQVLQMFVCLIVCLSEAFFHHSCLLMAFEWLGEKRVSFLLWQLAVCVLQKLTWKTKDVDKCTVRGKNSVSISLPFFLSVSCFPTVWSAMWLGSTNNSIDCLSKSAPQVSVLPEPVSGTSSVSLPEL